MSSTAVGNNSPTSESAMSNPEVSSSLSRDLSWTSITSDGNECFRSTDHAGNMLNCLRLYLDNQTLCDVVLISGIDGKRVPAHRLILAASSAYFSAMFTGSLRETKENEVTLGQVRGDTLRQLVAFCYTGIIDLHEETVEEVMTTANLLQLTTVVQGCCNFLVRQLHPSNSLGFALFAEQQNCTILLRRAEEYTGHFFIEVSHHPEFVNLSAEEIMKLLSRDDLNVPSEQDIFRSAMLWIRFDPILRKRYIPQLLSVVRLPLLGPSFLWDQVEGVCDTKETLHLVLDALKWQMMPERRALVGTDRTRPRKSTIGRLLAVGGADLQRGSINIECYCPRLNAWGPVHQTTTRRLQFGAAVVGDKLIVVGGRDGLKTLNTVECLELSTLTWIPMHPMIASRHGLGVAVLEGPLYAVGGHDGWSYLSTVERWDPTTRTWSMVAPMTSMRSTAGVAALGGRLYVVGGRDGGACHRSVECYDPHTNKWTVLAAMSKRRGGVGVAAAYGYLYALGGHDSPISNPMASRTDTVERYDPATDTWTLICSLNTGRDGIGCALLGHHLIAVGGYDGHKTQHSVEQYDPVRNEWASLTPTKYARGGACVIAVPNDLLKTIIEVSM